MKQSIPWRDKPRKPAWWPIETTVSDIEAIRACWDGKATPQQQRHVMEFVILAASQHTELSFRSDADGGERETAFAQGRWFVGQTLVKALNLGPAYIAELRRKEHAGPHTSAQHAAPGEPVTDPDKHSRSGS